MGIGYVLIVRDADVAPALRELRAVRARPVVIGAVVKGSRNVTVEW
jgi:phosphoribosylaminoimidazole (AIR) synthetase